VSKEPLLCDSVDDEPGSDEDKKSLPERVIDEVPHLVIELMDFL
jgi:hypothetical protein